MSENMQRPELPLSKASKPHRDLSLDAIRGFTILAVVLGHAIQFNTTHPFDRPLERAIGSFEMPLFWFISGYLAYGRVECRLLMVVRRKFLQLAVPFFAWVAVYSLLRNDHTGRNILHDAWMAATVPMNGLWFLWVLFLAFCLLALLRVSERVPAWIAMIIAWYAIYRLAGQVPSQAIGLLAMYFPFFGIAYLCKQHRQIFTSIKLPMFIISAVLFTTLLLRWQMWGLYPLEHLHDWSPSGVHLGQYLTLSYGYVVSFAGIGTFWGLFTLYGRALGRVQYWLAWLGLLTFDIYVSHSLFITLGWWPSQPMWLAVLIAFIVGLLGSLALSLALRQSRVTAQLFLGNGSLPRTFFRKWPGEPRNLTTQRNKSGEAQR